MALADTSLLESIIGREALAALIQTSGGLALSIPRRLPLSGPLADLPPAAQEALIRYAGGDTIYIPKCDGSARAARDAEIRALYDSGWRVQDIARRFRLTERWVYEILNTPADDMRQGALF